MADAALGSLVVELSANLARFEQDMNRAASVTQVSVGKIERIVSGAANALSFVGVAGGLTAAAAAVAGFTSRAVESLAALDDLSESTSLSVEFLSQLQGLTRTTGADLAGLAGSAGKFARSMADALSGDKGAQAAFQEVGISVDDLRSKNIDQLFERFARSIANAADPTLAIATAVKLAGREAASQIPTFNDLAKIGLEQATVSTRQAQEAEALQNQFRALEKVAFDLGTELAKMITPRLLRDTQELALAIRSLGAIDTFFNLGADPAPKIQELTDQLSKLEAQRKRAADPERGNALAVQDLDKQIAKAQRLLSFNREVAALRAGAARAAPGELEFGPPVLPASTRGLRRLQEDRQRIAAETTAIARSIDDYETRISQAVGGAINESAVVKTRELQDVIKRLDELFLDGKISVDIYESALQKLTGTLAGVKEPADELAGLLSRTSDAVQENANRLTALADNAFFDGTLTERQRDQLLGLINGYQNVTREAQNASSVARDIGLTFASAAEEALARWEGFGKFFQGLEQDLIKFASRKLLTEPLLNAADAVFGSGKGAGASGFQGLVESGLGLLKGLIPSFDVGTPYVAQTGLAMVHQGERIVPAEQNRSGGWGGDINISINASGQMDRRSAMQMANEVGRAVARATRRNG